MAIFNKIQEIAKQTSYFKDYMLDPISKTAYKTPLLRKDTHQKIRGHYEYVQKVNKNKQLPVEIRQQKTRKHKYYSRLNRVIYFNKLKYDLQTLTNNLFLFFFQKYNNRVKTFKAYEESAIVGFGTKEECEAVLNRGYMSEEEDGEVVRENVARTFQKLVPLWRSDKVSYQSE